LSNILIDDLRNEQMETEQKIWKKIWNVIDVNDNVKILESDIQNLMLHRKEILKKLNDLNSNDISIGQKLIVSE